MSGPFPARYSGRCPSCSAPIEIGDQLRYSADGDLLCVECAQNAEPDRRPGGHREGRACSRCHLYALLTDGLCPDCRAEQ